MPPHKACPCCSVLLADWHLEWYALDAQRAIVGAKAAMECPRCRSGVRTDGWDVEPAPPAVSVLRRDLAKAASWARTQSRARSLVGYLKTEQGQPFAGLWTASEVQDADRRAAVQAE
jgi:ribosomal protein S27AE